MRKNGFQLRQYGDRDPYFAWKKKVAEKKKLAKIKRMHLFKKKLDKLEVQREEGLLQQHP